MANHHKQSHTLMHHKFDVRHLGALPELASSRLLGLASEVIIGVFFPIFLYEFFGLSLQWTLFWFAASYLTRIPLLILGAKIFSRTGLVKSMFIGSAFWIGFYAIAYVLNVAPEFHTWTFLGLLIASLSLHNAFYWAPFHVDFAKFTSKKRRGKQLGTLYALQRLIGVAGPIVGGFLIATFSYGAAFAVGIGCILASLVPLSFLPRTNVQYEYGFFETFKMMFAKKYRYLTLSMIAYGADSAIGYIIWPIFLFIVFDGAYLSIGIFASLLVVVNVILQLIVGKQIDHHHKRKMIKFGVDLYALGWFFKAFVSSVGGVFAASTFHTFGSIMMRTPVDVMVYEKAADSGHYIDEFTVIREIALSMGRSGAIAVLAIVTIFAPIWTAFIFAAVIAFGISTLTKFTLEEVHI
ncbi:MFS transporter [Candidatus Uhrbacteria bacterium]|jgi:MFS family permease|nr:MFS transporter [Candidatus Uhrbacteria bacterium]MBT7717079.1 MFS transporter [Candidatus Uhrbacteria bacterium]